MELQAIKMRRVQVGDDLSDAMFKALASQSIALRENDILVIASKIVSYSEGRLARLSDVNPSKRAVSLAKQYCLEPEFAELILQEADEFYGGVDKAVLVLRGSTIAPNAGIDNKNAPEGFVVLWPADPKKTAAMLRKKIAEKTGKNVGVIIIDSGLVPLRIGTSGLALAVAGFRPIRDYRKEKDLFGKPIAITRLAIADDLASAAHLLMGESDESTPLVLVRGAHVDFVEQAFDARDMMMPPNECIFMNTFLGGRLHLRRK